MADALTRMRAICADLPHVKEKLHFGDAVFTSGGKIFASCSRTEVVFQPADAMRDVIDGDPRFKPYPRDKRAFAMDVSGPTDWNLVKQLVFDSYGLHAGTVTRPAKKPTAKKPTAKKPAAKKPAKKPTKKPTKKR